METTTITPQRINALEVVRAIFVVLSKRGVRSLYVDDEALSSAMYAAFQKLEELAPSYGLKITFRVLPSDNRTFDHACATLLQFGVLRYADRDLILNASGLQLLGLSEAPGGPQLYEALATAFLNGYHTARRALAAHIV